MAQNDPYTQFKQVQKQGWGFFAPLETITTSSAADLVDFAKINSSQNVLDCACGTGVVAITAARRKAQVKGLDLSPTLLERAKYNAQIAHTEIEFTEGDVENLPYESNSFDVVLSQFGHMFAPRPEIAISEMLRVLKPGGLIAFSTWPPDHFIAQIFAVSAQYSPPPAGVAAPAEWGIPEIIQKRLGNKVKDIVFNRSVISVPTLSPQHSRDMFEKSSAPLIKISQELDNDPMTLKKFRDDIEKTVENFSKNNILSQHFLMTRAIKI